MSTKDKIKKSTTYKILIKLAKGYFNVGTIVIKTYTGDILYIPSAKYLNNLNDGSKKIIDHISWHASGRVSIKFKDNDNKYAIVQEKDDRQEISEIGFQEILKDLIRDFKKLPKYQKVVIPLDVVLDVGNYLGPVSFNFSIVSGGLIAAKHKGQEVPIKSVNIKEKRNGLDSTIRVLGYHSGSGDVILQYSLRKIEDRELKGDRGIFIPFDMKISKLNTKPK